MKISSEMREKILGFQKNEITEYHIYSGLAKIVRDPGNAAVLEGIAKDELRHYHFWKRQSGAGISTNGRGSRISASRPIFRRHRPKVLKARPDFSQYALRLSPLAFHPSIGRTQISRLNFSAIFVSSF